MQPCQQATSDRKSQPSPHNQLPKSRIRPRERNVPLSRTNHNVRPHGKTQRRKDQHRLAEAVNDDNGGAQTALGRPTKIGWTFHPIAYTYTMYPSETVASFSSPPQSTFLLQHSAPRARSALFSALSISPALCETQWRSKPTTSKRRLR